MSYLQSFRNVLDKHYFDVLDFEILKKILKKN